MTKPEGKGRKNGVALLPAAARREVYEKFQAHTDKVLNTLLTILESDEASHADRISAGKEILARGWGAVPQYHVVEKTMEHKVTINSAVLRAMTPAQLESFQAMLEQVTDADVVDAEAVERGE